MGRMIGGAGSFWICVAAALVLNSSATLRAADDSKNTSNQPAKLAWHAVRPVRSDVQSAQSDKDQAVQTAKYEQDVFDDDKGANTPKSTSKQTTSQTSSARIVLTAGQSSEMYSVKARRAAPVDDDIDTLPAPSTREMPPPLRVDSEATQREPAEINPIDPIRPSMKRTYKTFQSQLPPATPQPESQAMPPQPAPPDSLQGIEVQPSGPERRPEEDCHEEYERVKNYTLVKLHLDISPPKEEKMAGPGAPNVPYECSLGNEAFTPRSWQCTTFTWKASALCHKPLYFEEVAMERYGHSHGPGCEYVTSFVHFFGNFALLPYWVGVDTPCECIYDLGYYRPGNCAPYMFDPFPISCRGAVTGGAGYCGVIALFP